MSLGQPLSYPSVRLPSGAGSLSPGGVVDTHGSNNHNNNVIEITSAKTMKEKFDEKCSSGGELSDLKLEEGSVKLGDHIKSGGFGNVYKGILTRKKKTSVENETSASAAGGAEGEETEEIEVAVKIPIPEKVKDPLTEVSKEAVHLDRLNKQGCPVVKFYGVIFIDTGEIQSPSLVMELADGSFSDFLKKHRDSPLSVDKALHYSLYITSLIASLHCADPLTTHKDIKPGNFLTFKRKVEGKEEFLIKVTDVGLAKATTHGDSTSAGVAGGTAYYSPPEIYQKRISTASDVWMLGVTLMELLTGKKPSDFEPPNVTQNITDATLQVRDIMLEQLPELLAARGAPMFLNSVIAHCLQTVRGSRPCTARIVLLEILKDAIESGALSGGGTVNNCHNVVKKYLMSSGVVKQGGETLVKEELRERLEAEMHNERCRKQKISRIENSSELSHEDRAPEIFYAMDNGLIESAISLIREATPDQLTDTYSYYYDNKRYFVGVRVRGKHELDPQQQEQPSQSVNLDHLDVVDAGEEGDRKKAPGSDPSSSVSGSLVSLNNNIATAAAGGGGGGGGSVSGMMGDFSSSDGVYSPFKKAPSSSDSSSPSSPSPSSSSSSLSSVTESIEHKSVSIAHRAVLLGQSEILKALIERKAKCLHEYDGHGYLPIQLAVCNKSLERIAVFMLTDPSVREEFKHDLHKCVHKNNSDSVKVGCKLVHLAASFSTPPVMKAFVESHPEELVERKSGAHRLTPLLQAVATRNTEVINFIIENHPADHVMEEAAEILLELVESKAPKVEVAGLVNKKLRQKIGDDNLLKLLQIKKSSENVLHRCVSTRNVGALDFFLGHELVKKANLVYGESGGGTPAQYVLGLISSEVSQDCLDLIAVFLDHHAMDLKTATTNRASLKSLARKHEKLRKLLEEEYHLEVGQASTKK